MTTDVPALGELARRFEYLLNAMERASQEDTPADHGYAEKRRAVFEYVAQLVALATGGAEATKLIENCRVALRSIGPVYYHVEVAAQRARKGGNETAADILEHVHGRLFWMDHALGTMRERSNAEAARASRPTEETDHA